MKKQTVLKASLVGLASIFVLSGCVESRPCCTGYEVVTQSNQELFYWQIQKSSLGIGSHNITVKAGSYNEDQAQISRIVDVQ